MKIVIIGSMKFADKMLDAQKILQDLGHEVVVPYDTKMCADNPECDFASDPEHFKTYDDIIKAHFDLIVPRDAILVLNYPKNDINGYVGGSTLMEMGIAHHFNKKIFLLFDPPLEKDIRYAIEINLMKPIVLGGDVNNIINHL